MKPAPFGISGKRRYAIDPGSLEVSDADLALCTIRAVWFKRKDRVTAACIGTLWDALVIGQEGLAGFLAMARDGRYGGTCEGRWDGTQYWGAQEPEVMAAHLALLRPMLADYPDLPPGFDGWWVYET